MTWTPDDYLTRLYEQLEAVRGQRNESAARKRERLLARLRHALGSFPDASGQQAENAELQPELLERVELEGGLIRERVAFTAAEGLRVPAYVLIPQQAKPQRLPAVLAWHGHGYGSREAVGLLPDGSENSGSPGIHANFALELARRGMVVIAPEVIGFGERRLQRDMEKDPKASSSCVALAAALLMAGKSLAGLRVYEAMRAADYAVSREEVDPDRIGTMGFSGGGMIASLFAALDERVKAAVLCSYSNTYKDSILARNHCIDNYIPGILPDAEMPDLLGLIAPRALFIESGTGDKLFPVDAVRAIVGELQALYETMGAADRFASDIFEGKHEISGRRSYEWLLEQLQRA